MTMSTHPETPDYTLGETTPEPRDAAWRNRLFETLRAICTSHVRAVLLEHGHPPPGGKST